MQTAAVLAGPLIIAAIVAAVVVLGGIYVMTHYARALKAQRDESLANAERARIPPVLFRRQQEAIDAVIAELESHPFSYETFPESIRNQLFATHDKARELEGR